eukprot:6209037-Pleurochrysis_carterae.AAC.1
MKSLAAMAAEPDMGSGGFGWGRGGPLRFSGLAVCLSHRGCSKAVLPRSSSFSLAPLASALS